MCRRKLERMSDKYVIYYLQTRACVVEWPGQCHFLLCRLQSLKQSVWTDDSHWGGQRHFHFCTFGAVCKDAWDRQHLTASYYKLLEVISCWIDAWDSQHHAGFLLCITAMVAWWICDIGTFVGAFEPSSTRSRARGRMDIIIEEFSRRRLCDQ